MNFKPLIAAICLIAPLAAAPSLRLHDGKEWKELDAAALAKLPRSELIAKARDGKEKRFSGIPLAGLTVALR